MKTEHLCQSFNLLGYDVNEIRVIQPNRTANPSQLIRSYFDLDQICQKYDGQANLYIGVNERSTINATKQDIQAVNFVIIDLDSVRPDNNQPANQHELEATVDASEVIADFFVTQGFQPPIRAISGNGCHLWAKIPRLELAIPEVTKILGIIIQDILSNDQIYLE